MRKSGLLLAFTGALLSGCSNFQLPFLSHTASSLPNVGAAIIGTNSCGHGGDCPTEATLSTDSLKVGDTYTLSGTSSLSVLEVWIYQITATSAAANWKDQAIEVATVSVNNGQFSYTDTLQDQYHDSSKSFSVTTGTPGYEFMLGLGDSFQGFLFSLR